MNLHSSDGSRSLAGLVGQKHGVIVVPRVVDTLRRRSLFCAAKRCGVVQGLMLVDVLGIIQASCLATVGLVTTRA